MPEYTADDYREVADNTDPLDRIAATIHKHTGDLPQNTLNAVVLQLASAPPIEQSVGADERGDIHLSLTHDASTNISQLISVLSDLHPGTTTRLNGTNTTKTGVLGTTRSGEIEPGPLLNPDVAHTSIEQFDALDNDTTDAFSQVLNSQTYSFANSYFTDTVEAPGSILVCTPWRYDTLDEYEPIYQQLNLPGNILGTVDLILTCSDSTDSTVGVESDPLSGEFVKAYLNDIQQFNPVLTEDATTAIDTYASTRSQQFNSEHGPQSISEATFAERISRLARAHARLRRSNTVSSSDVSRITTLTDSVYSRLGYPIDTEPDSSDNGDIEEKELPIREVKEVIDTLSQQHREGAPRDKVQSDAIAQGIAPNVLEQTLEKMKSRADIYEPETDHYRVV